MKKLYLRGYLTNEWNEFLATIGTEIPCVAGIVYYTVTRSIKQASHMIVGRSFKKPRRNRKGETYVPVEPLTAEEWQRCQAFFIRNVPGLAPDRIWEV